METRELKARLRADLRAARRALTAAQRALAAAQAGALLARSDAWRAARVVALYQACGAELDLAALRADAHAAGKVVALPRVEGERLSLHLVAVETPLRPSALGVPEPPAETPRVDLASLDLIVVPGLGFDRRGGRLGQGGGYYDRLLATLPAAVRRIGIGYDLQWVEAVPREDHDGALHAVVTPAGWVDCGI